ncbi:SIR2 family NAD-dependent protein deacylase [Erwinia sp. OPT-41]|uniref:SIR2 family protein n=1 Tax=Erwinia plantamica TaxID=3237104 RepID=A0ABW7CIV3_9GAMM
MSWPESLAREIAENRCIFHLGSGLSCQSVDENQERPLSWSNLLTDLNDRVVSDSGLRLLVSEFISEKKFLDAAEIIRTHGHQADFYSIITECFFTKRYIPSSSHNIIVEVSPKIIVTTNYDSIIEDAMIEISGRNSFHSFEYNTDGLIDAIRSPATILLKFHGCAQHSRNIILSRSDYFKLRDEHNVTFEIVTSLYKINTVLFIGCGIEDPDINLILENIRLRIGTSSPSYALVGSLSYAAKIKESIKKQYNIELIIYEQADPHDHSKFEEILSSLKDKVEEVKAKYGI